MNYGQIGIRYALRKNWFPKRERKKKLRGEFACLMGKFRVCFVKRERDNLPFIKYALEAYGYVCMASGGCEFAVSDMLGNTVFWLSMKPIFSFIILFYFVLFSLNRISLIFIEFHSNKKYWSKFLVRSIPDDDPKCVYYHYELTSDISTASFGDLNHIINLDDESICIRFQTASGMCVSSFIVWAVTVSNKTRYYEYNMYIWLVLQTRLDYAISWIIWNDPNQYSHSEQMNLQHHSTSSSTAIWASNKIWCRIMYEQVPIRRPFWAIWVISRWVSTLDFRLFYYFSFFVLYCVYFGLLMANKNSKFSIAPKISFKSCTKKTNLIRWKCFSNFRAR